MNVSFKKSHLLIICVLVILFSCKSKKVHDEVKNELLNSVRNDLIKQFDDYGNVVYIDITLKYNLIRDEFDIKKDTGKFYIFYLNDSIIPFSLNDDRYFIYQNEIFCNLDSNIINRINKGDKLFTLTYVTGKKGFKGYSRLKFNPIYFFSKEEFFNDKVRILDSIYSKQNQFRGIDCNIIQLHLNSSTSEE